MICTILAENASAHPDLEPEHGLSLHFADTDRQFLFDCGQTELFLKNAGRLNISLAQLDFVAISHGHYDHAGGLRSLADCGLHPRVFISRHAWAEKLAVRDGTERQIGIHDGAAVKSRIKRLHEIEGFVVPAPGIYLLAAAAPDFSPGAEAVYRTRAQGAASPDRFLDEMTMVIDHGNCLTAVTGCAHQGLENILKQVRLYFPVNRLKTVIGGFHLAHASAADIDRVAIALRAQGIEALYPCHCTGDKAVAQLSEALPGIVHPCRTGSRITLP
jgi:7,8-dihydropterin-6-yl-methyl-4-(beta-D-ribofuranosyl)aminobenzene 5'-phosphate synthase